MEGNEERIMTTALFEIINKPIDVEEVRQKVLSRNAGAITLFIGTVREITNGKKHCTWNIKLILRWPLKCLNKLRRKYKSSGQKRK